MTACTHCRGAGKLKEPCATCGGRGWVATEQGGHNCRCSNLRCIKCGGEGREIEPVRRAAFEKVVAEIRQDATQVVDARPGSATQQGNDELKAEVTRLVTRNEQLRQRARELKGEPEE